MCDEFNERFLEPPMRSLATNSRNFACAIAKYIFFIFSFNFIFFVCEMLRDFAQHRLNHQSTNIIIAAICEEEITSSLHQIKLLQIN